MNVETGHLLHPQNVQVKMGQLSVIWPKGKRLRVKCSACWYVAGEIRSKAI